MFYILLALLLATGNGVHVSWGCWVVFGIIAIGQTISGLAGVLKRK